MCSLKAAQIYLGGPVGPSTYICAALRLHIYLFIGAAQIYLGGPTGPPKYTCAAFRLHISLFINFEICLQYRKSY